MPDEFSNLASWIKCALNASNAVNAVNPVNALKQ